ncbi:hypothetical protein CL616_04260 [archaeon]|jgi:hypothetical protein|nr:hypothetical protein [archaeon]
MKKFSITLLFILLSLLLQNCSILPIYQIKTINDPYYKSTIITEQWNKVHSFFESIALNLRYSPDYNKLELRFDYIDDKWLFIQQYNSFLFLFEDDDVLTLSTSSSPNRDVRSGSGGGIREWGNITLYKEDFSKLLNKKLKSLRVIGSKYHVEFKIGFPTLQNRWRNFSKLHLDKYW